MVAVVVITKGVVDQVYLLSNSDKAEERFIDLCEVLIGDWDSYSSEDVDSCVENGYVLTDDNGSICITHPVEEV